MAAADRIQQWLSGPYDSETKKAILNLQKTDPKQLDEAFASTLAFGTAGMRALMGPGTARMNRYTVQMATQGLVNYILKQGHGSVFIGYDSRHHSEEFAREAARVCAANGVTAYLCPQIRPTPFVSFGVRYKKCTAGVMITASHNPKGYNGYKVYWSDGAQVTAPHDEEIVKEVQKIHSITDVKIAEEHHPLILTVEPTLDDAYLQAIRTTSLLPDENHRVGDKLKITYTPLHGTGIKLLPKALRDWGFINFNLVDAQIVSDGDFPTVPVPNPENLGALALGLEQLVSSRSDLLLATDPDADRIGVAVMHHGKPVIFNGNQIAAILCEHICRTLHEQKKLPSNGAVITTIVTTDLLSKIASHYQVACKEVLTGFKYIGEMIHLWESTGNPYQFLFGAEESYGYLRGTHARDKDAIVSGCLLAEIALLLKIEGRTLVDFLQEIYKKYGTYIEGQITIDFPMETMRERMDLFRKKRPAQIAGKTVVSWIDYLHDSTDLPQSDVLLLRLSDESKIAIRPSGTEPKLKIYAGLRNQPPNRLEELLHAVKALI